MVHAVALGPLRATVMSLGYLGLYPLLLGRFGVEVVGLWSLLSVFVGLSMFADAGFSQLLMRDASVARARREITEAYSDYLAARTSYALLGILLASGVGVWLLTAPDLNGVYPLPGLGIAFLLLCFAVLFQLSAVLDAAILAARRDAAYAGAAQGTAPILILLGAYGGAFTGHPIEGLALGMATCYATLLLVLRRRLRIRHVTWTGDETGRALRGRIVRVPPLARRGLHFYTTSLGFIVREPLFRILIAANLGLGAAAALDVALRTTRTGRDLIIPGFTALMPSFASLAKLERQDDLLETLRLALMVLAVSGALLLGGLIAAAPLLFPLWLGDVPPGAIEATRLLAVWQFTVLLYIPFQLLLQATGHERIVAHAVWIHTALVIVLVPSAALLRLSLTEACMYWLLASLLTQAVVVYVVHRRLGLVRKLGRGRRLGATVLASVAFIVWCLALSSLPALQGGPPSATLGLLGASASILVIGGGVSLRSAVRAFLRQGGQESSAAERFRVK